MLRLPHSSFFAVTAFTKLFFLTLSLQEKGGSEIVAKCRELEKTLAAAGVRVKVDDRVSWFFSTSWLLYFSWPVSDACLTLFRQLHTYRSCGYCEVCCFARAP